MQIFRRHSRLLRRAAGHGYTGQSCIAHGHAAAAGPFPRRARFYWSSHYFDAGVTQGALRNLEIGIDGYYKIATDLLDDGQIGQAYVLSSFNYAHACNEGAELKVKYQDANFKAYSNVVSNRFLFDPAELAHIDTRYIYTDHTQTWTGSAGMSHLWNGTKLSTDMIYGSGLRSGFANIDHLPLYTQVNLGVSREFQLP